MGREGGCRLTMQPIFTENCMKMRKFCSKVVGGEAHVSCPFTLNYVSYFTVEGKFICWGGEVAIDENLVCDGNYDCPIMEHLGISSDELATDCAEDGEY